MLTGLTEVPFERCFMYLYFNKSFASNQGVVWLIELVEVCVNQQILAQGTGYKKNMLIKYFVRTSSTIQIGKMTINMLV